jgi:hypothetical protein
MPFVSFFWHAASGNCSSDIFSQETVMTRQAHGFILAAALFFISPALGQNTPPPDVAPAPAPATEEPKKELTPQQQRIADLILQLASDDFTKRDAASEELQKMGPDALPALRDALKSEDPSIRSYAEYLVPKMEGKRNPRQFDPNVQWNAVGPRRIVGGNIIANRNANGMLHINVGARDGFRRTNIHEGDRQTTIEEGPDGITMSITEKGEKKEFKAKNIEELRKDAPEAAAIYDKFAARNQLLGQPRAFRIAPNIFDAQIRDQIQQAEVLQDRMINEQQAKLRDLLDANRIDLHDNELERMHQRLKAETAALEARLRDVEAMHKRLLEQTHAAQKRLADLERQQQPQPERPR